MGREIIDKIATVVLGGLDEAAETTCWVGPGTWNVLHIENKT